MSKETFATWADENGASAKQRGELMGNSAEINANVRTGSSRRGLRPAKPVGQQWAGFHDCEVRGSVAQESHETRDRYNGGRRVACTEAGMTFGLWVSRTFRMVRVRTMKRLGELG